MRRDSPETTINMTNNIIVLFEEFNKIRNENYDTLLALANICSDITWRYEQSLPFHINVICSAARGRLKETAHSKILHDLLHHPVVFNSFISNVMNLPLSFFENVTIDYPDYNRIDLSFHSKEKFLIIENKVNGAQEQCGQIYRYKELAKRTHRESNIYILYLNPVGLTPPSLFSRSKNGNGNEEDSDTIPINRIIVKDYKNDILNWLKIVEKQIQSLSNEYLLVSAIRQYIDYLEEYFRINNRYKQLNKQMYKEIEKLLGLGDLSIKEKISVLSEKIEELDILKNQLETSKNEFMRELWDKTLTSACLQLQNQFDGVCNFKVFNHKVPEIGFDAIYGDERFHVTVVYYTDNKPYWRIYGDKKLSDEAISNITTLIKADVTQIKYENIGWDLYDSTSLENWQLRLVRLTELFASSAKFSIILQ